MSSSENKTKKLLKVTAETTCLSVILPTFAFMSVCFSCPLSPALTEKTFFNLSLRVCFLQPFGVNQPGPYVMYTTVDSNGYLKNASGQYFFFLIFFFISFHVSAHC